MFAQLGTALRVLRGRIAARAERDVRLTVFVCIWTVAGSLAVCALAQISIEQIVAYRRAVAFTQKRADDLAVIVNANLTRLEATGLLFANGGLAEEAAAALPGVRGIAVADASGQNLRHSGEAIDMMALSAMMRGRRTVVGTGKNSLIVFKDLDRVIAVSFDPSALAPAALIDRAVLVSPTGVILAGGGSGQGVATTHTADWPVAVQEDIAKTDLPSLWTGRLSLALFAFLVPLLSGFWLMRVVASDMAWREKTARVIRALRRSRPRWAKLQGRLAGAERAHVESLRAQSELFARVCQEISSPLNSTVGFAEIIAHGMFGPVPAKYGEYAHDIGTAGRHAFAKMGALHALARLQAGTVKPQIAPCDVVEIVTSVLNENASYAFQSHIWLEMAPSEPTEVASDIHLVARILRNLIANSLSRTPTGGRVRIQVYRDAADAVVLVEDTGQHFEASANDKPVRRGRFPPPTHLDLAIAVELARILGGSLRFSQSRAAGCCAELRLPR